MGESKILLLVDSLALGVEDEKSFSGGIKVEREIIRNMLDKGNIRILPKLNTIVPNDFTRNINKEFIDFLINWHEQPANNVRDFSPKEFLQNMTKLIKEENIRLAIDLNYWPLSYTHFINYYKSIYKNRMPLAYLIGDDVYYYAKKAKIKGAVLLQGLGMTEYFIGIPKNLINYLIVKKHFPIDVFFDLRNKIRYVIYKGIREKLIAEFLKHSKAISKVYGVSDGQLKALGLDKSNKASVVNLAIDDEIVKIRDRINMNRKKKYMVFYARLISLKGLLEIPFIVRKTIDLTGMSDLKLYVMGKFPCDNLKNLFFRIVSDLKLDDNIVYKGFVERRELYNIIAEAYVTIYPSHEDSFSLAVLESIALGTPVVAYDILTIRLTYQGIPSVIFAKEFDIDSMARNVAKILKMKEDEYYSIVVNNKVEEFVRKHGSWKATADSLYNDLMKLIE